MFRLAWLLVLAAGFWIPLSPVSLGQEPSSPPKESAPDQNQDDSSTDQDEDKAMSEADAQEPGDDDGAKDLERAIELKATARTARDLDDVVSACEAALAKGLDDDSKKLAEAMIKSTLFDHAKQLSDRIFEGQRNSRWRFDRREALQRLERVLKMDPEMVDAHLITARLEMLPGGDLSQARASLNLAIEAAANQNVKLSEALLLRAALAEDDESQLADLNQAIIIDSTNLRALLARAQYRFGNGEYGAAVTDIRSAIDLGYEGVDASEMLLQSLIADDKLDEAEQEVDKAVANAPDNSTFLFLRAQVRSELKRPDEALADIDQILKADSKNAQALLLKTTILYEQERLDEAMETVETVLAVQPGLVRGILLRSLIFAAQEKFDEAINDIQQLVDFAPENDGFQLQMAMYYNAAKKSDEAVEIYNHLLEADPNSDSALRGRGDAYLSLGEHAKAIADYEMAIELQEDEPDAATINNLAWVLATSPKSDLRDGNRSLELGKQACELTEYKESYAVSTLAAGYAEIGDFDQARHWAAKAVELGENEKSESIDNLRRELEGYQRNKPWRELLSEDLAGPEGEETSKSSDSANDKNADSANPSGESADPDGVNPESGGKSPE